MRMVGSTDKVNSNGLMVPRMLVTLLMVQLVAKVDTIGLMEEYMTVNGSKVRCMELAS